MKKDKKFLTELEYNLGNIRSKYKKEIISKYENIIKEGKENNKKITTILKELGDPKDIAIKEKKLIKKESFFSNVWNNINNSFSKIKSKFSRKRSKNNKSFELSNIFKKKDPVELELKKDLKLKKKKLKKELKNQKKELNKKIKKEKPKRSFKETITSFFAFITKDISFKRKKTSKEKLKKIFKEEKTESKEVIENIKEEIHEEISEVSQIVPETHIFESKEKRRKRIILKILGIILTVLLLFIWMWVSVIFIASCFAYLDGVHFIGINLALFGLDALVLWIIIMVNRAIFKKKTHYKLNIIVTVVSVFIIALGIALSIRQISSIKTIKDVSVKYNMTTKLTNYNLSNDRNKKFVISFNSNYATQYVIDYDETLNNKVRVEVKYYECYYDYYVKETSNNVYVSLKLDNRDRLSVYIDDLKEGMVMDNDELSRYSVKITINPNDAGRLVIKD